MKHKKAAVLFLAGLLLTGCLSTQDNKEELPVTEVEQEDAAAALEDWEAPEDSEEPQPQMVDLMIFAGQSNMAGNGDHVYAPDVPDGWAYEFRAVTDPTRLYPIIDPFGLEENKEDGIYDIWKDSGTRRKLGDLIPSFVNSYYKETGVPLVGVSASEGGTRIKQWLPGTERYEDLKSRTRSAQIFLEQNEEYELRRTYLIWCQGESDGDAGMSEDAYYQEMEQLVNALVSEELIDACMVIRIGNFRNSPTKYDNIIKAQTRLCLENEHTVLISTRFAEMAETGMMRDIYHYTQEGYNLVGEEAGKNCGKYANTGMEPILWDYEFEEEYTPHMYAAE